MIIPHNSLWYTFLFVYLPTATILNPSFENPAVTTDAFGTPSYWSGDKFSYLSVIISGSNDWGGILAADGNQLLAFGGGELKQSLEFKPGLTYVLAFFAASWDKSGSLTATVGENSMLVQSPLLSTTMANYSMWFVADSFSKSVIITGYRSVLDYVTVNQGIPSYPIV